MFTGETHMTDVEKKDADFSAVVDEALKKMQIVTSTAGSTSYEVHRLSGELIVRRGGGKIQYEVPNKQPPVKKTG